MEVDAAVVMAVAVVLEVVALIFGTGVDADLCVDLPALAPSSAAGVFFPSEDDEDDFELVLVCNR